jgi:hypothetical protein
MCRRTFGLTLLLLTSACLAAGCASGRPPDTTGALTSRSADVITAGELSQGHGLQNAWDAVVRLRPRFLRNGGTTSFSGGLDNRAIVRVDQVTTGPPEKLREVDIQYVQEIRYYNAADATARFGGTYGRAVIHVITKAR